MTAVAALLGYRMLTVWVPLLPGARVFAGGHVARSSEWRVGMGPGHRLERLRTRQIASEREFKGSTDNSHYQPVEFTMIHDPVGGRSQ